MSFCKAVLGPENIKTELYARSVLVYEKVLGLVYSLLLLNKLKMTEQDRIKGFCLPQCMPSVIATMWGKST